MTDFLYRLYTNEYYIVQLLAAEALFCFSLPRRGKFALRCSLSAAVCLVASFFVIDNLWTIAGFLQYFPLVYLLLFLIVIAAVFVCFKGSLRNRLFCILGGYLAQNVANNVNQIAAYYLPDYVALEITLMCVAFVAVYTVCWFLFAQKLYKGDCVNIDNKAIVFVGSVIAVSCFILDSFTVSSDLGVRVKTALRVSIILTGFLALAFQFSLLAKGRVQQERELLERLFLEKKQQYEVASENMEMLNVCCHDMRHFMEDLARGGKMPDGIHEKSIALYDSVFRTGNKALDVVLTEKSFACAKENIALNVICDGEKLGFMSAYEIYALFGNILDNAVEAVRALPDDDMRVIKLKIIARDNILSIHQQNYSAAPLTLVDGLPQTSKQDKTLHGYGVKSIRQIVRTYGGSYVFGEDKNIFTLDILFPLELHYSAQIAPNHVT